MPRSLRPSAAAVPRPSPGNGSREEAPSALLFIAGNLVNGSGTLLDELLTKAGFRDAAIDYGLAFTGTLPIETIAAKPPRVIFTPGPSRTATLRARVLARTGANTVEAAFPRSLVNCGGPTIVPAITRLAAIHREITSPEGKLALLALLVVLAFGLSLIAGKTWIPADAWFSADPRFAIIVELRLPRALLGLAIGTVLGLSGAVLQGYLRNPLADPAVVGVSSSAALGAVAAIILGIAGNPPGPVRLRHAHRQKSTMAW